MDLKKSEKLVVLSLGGSLIYPNGGPDITFLIKFNELIRDHVKKGTRFIIIAGGGAVCREYQKAARKIIGKIPDHDVDWLGIHVTRLNAQLLRTIFADICYPKVIHDYDKKEEGIQEPVLIAGGWKPGWSTDYCSVILAKQYNAQSVINLSNIEVVYDRDPKKFPNAKPIEKISWENFEKLIPEKWVPGANVPFDPVATRLAKRLDLTVFILKGSNLKNLERVLEGKPFKGTIITPFKHDSSFYNRAYFELGIGYKGYTTTSTGKFLAHLTNFYRAALIKLFLKPKTLLDVGCGTGLLVFYLRKMGVQAFGIEISEYGLSKAHPDISRYLRAGNILKLPYKTNFFDMVTTFNVLEHLKEKEIPEALLECNRVTRKYSLHKIYTRENKWIREFHRGDISQISVFSRNWWDHKLAEMGFRKKTVFFPRLPSFMETIFILDKK